jgi:branched-chain amino acid transport system substrate-binding protein
MMRYFHLMMALVVFIPGLLTACQPATPPFECTDAIGCVDIAPGQPIEIGALLFLSVDPASIGKRYEQVIELAFSDRGNLLLGHPLKVQSEDEGCTAEKGGATVFKILTNTKIVAIIGPICTRPAVVVSEIMSDAGLVMVSPSNTAPSLTSLGGQPGVDWQPGYFRVVFNGEEQAVAAAVFAFEELGLTRAATIDDSGSVSVGLAGAFSKAFTELGGEITIKAKITRGDEDQHPVLEAILYSDAEMVYLPINRFDNVKMVLQSQEIEGFQDILLINTLLHEYLVDGVGAAGKGMYFVVPDVPQTPAVEKLSTAFEAKFGQPIQLFYNAFTYDAVNLVLDAIESVAVQDPDGTLHIGRQALRDALYATTDFQGVTGTLNCDEFGDCALPTFVVFRLDDPSAGIEGVRSNLIYLYTPD